MAKNKKNKSGKIYAIFITVWTIILTAAACFGLSIVWKYAEEYEQARPNNVMDAYVATLSESLWGDSIAETVASMPHEVQSDAECAEIVKEMLSGEDITYIRQSSTENTISYGLRINGSQFGTITIAEDESKADEVDFGMLPWIIYKEEFDFTGLYSSVSVTVPENFSVELNGHKLGKEYIVEEGIKYDIFEDYYDIYENLPTKVTYKFDNAFGELEPVVFDEDGNEFIIDETKDDSQYVKPCDDAQAEKLATFATTFCTRYYEYTSGIYDPTYGYQRLQPYMKLGSDLDERMKQAMDGLSWSHTVSLRMDSVVLNDATDIGGGFYIVDCTAQTTTLEPGRGEVVGTHNLKIFVTDTGSDIRAIMLELY